MSERKSGSHCYQDHHVPRASASLPPRKQKPHPENQVGLMLGYIKLKDRSKDHGIKDSTNTASVSWRLTESPKKLRIKEKTS